MKKKKVFLTAAVSIIAIVGSVLSIMDSIKSLKEISKSICNGEEF